MDRKCYAIIFALTTAFLFTGCGREPSTKSFETPREISYEACSASFSPSLPFLDASFSSDSILGGGRTQAGDFEFEAYLFCDKSLSPKPARLQDVSELPGLGIHTAWLYNGPKQQGDIKELWSFGSRQSVRTGWDGGLTRGSMGTYTGGIRTPAGGFLSSVISGSPLRFIMTIQSETTEVSVIISFEMVPVSDGFAPKNIDVEVSS